MGWRHGFREESEVIACKRRERCETVMREERSSSLKMSAMSSTGKASK